MRTEALKRAQKKYRVKYMKTDAGKRANASAILKWTYGITMADKEAMYEQQYGLCALCKLPLGGISRSHVDHSHETDEIRGLLHGKCNLLIGWLETCKELLKPAFEYLGWSR